MTLRIRSILPVAAVVALALATHACTAAPPASANAAFDAYIHTVESRLAVQHASPDRFVVLPSSASAQSLQGSPAIERIAIVQLSGALLHHWRATQFLPGAKAADLDRLLRNFPAYPALFAPQVERAQATPASPGHLHVTMRLRQHHVITVVLDTDYDVAFAQLDPQRRYSISRSTQVREIDSPDTHDERVLSPDREHGLLWRQNTYWSYEERDGGLYVQVESVSLTRAVPAGLGWAVGSYIGTIPRDSLAFTLSCVSRALLLQTKSAQ
jgi:hypothetical protein